MFMSGATPPPPAVSAVLRVAGGRRLTGTADVPGDKSISHRALILGALADGPARIRHLSSCADVARTLGAVRALGIEVEPEPEGTWIVHGRGPAGLGGPPVRIDCGDSGTTMRLLAGALAGQARAFVLDGHAGLRARPMHRVVQPLRAMGAEIEAMEGHAPLFGEGRPLRGGAFDLTRASAQVGSALLLAGLNATGETRVRYPAPVRDHTERLLAALGAPIRWDGTTSRLDGPVATLAPPAGGELSVPPDFSSAAFLLVGAAIVPGSSVDLSGVGVNPGRTGLLDVLQAMGARLAVDQWGVAGAEPTARLEVSGGRLVAAEVGGALVPRLIDELPLVAVLATQAEGRTVVRDAAELRVKECDRIAAIVSGLAAMGARIEERPDGFAVDGPTPLRGAHVAGHGDHRIVMALAVAGLAAVGETRVSDAWRVGDSFPGFVEALAALGADVAVVPAEAP